MKLRSLDTKALIVKTVSLGKDIRAIKHRVIFLPIERALSVTLRGTFVKGKVLQKIKLDVAD